MTDLAPVTPDELVRSWLSGQAAGTTRGYRGDMRKLAEHLGTSSVTETAQRVLSGTPGQANALALAWRNSMVDAGLSPATVNRRLSALRSLVSLAQLLGLVPWSLIVRGVPRKSYRDTKGVPWAEHVAAVEAASVRDAAILALLGDRGLRRGEVSSLDLGHVEDGCRSLLVAGKGRHGERERVTLADPTADRLRAWIVERGGKSGPLFPGMRRGGRLSGSQIARIVREAHGVGSHALRHCAITRALDTSGGDVRAAQRFARHGRPETTIVYDDARQDIAGAVARGMHEA